MASDEPRIIGITIGKLGGGPTDRIKPIVIEHNFDDLRDTALNGPVYNYLVYRFKRDGIETWARIYLPLDGSVMIMTSGPPENDGVKAFLSDVYDYLQRRYPSVAYLHEFAEKLR